MKSFEDWTQEIAKPETKNKTMTPPSIPDELLEYNSIEEGDLMPDSWVFPCLSCGEDSDILCDPWEFDQDMHYCGKDQWCCP